MQAPSPGGTHKMTEAENIWRNLHVINYFQIQQANSSVHPRETSSLKVHHSREKKAEGIGFTLGRRNIPDKKTLVFYKPLPFSGAGWTACLEQGPLCCKPGDTKDWSHLCCL